MKTVIIKSMMVVIVVTAMVHYALYLKTGELPWKNPLLNQSLSTSLPQVNLDKAIPGSAKTRVYKWVDEQGVLNYSQEPPPATVNTELLEVDPNVNLIQGTPVVELSVDPRPRSILIGDSASGAPELTPIEKAQAAKALLEARDREQQRILDSL